MVASESIQVPFLKWAGGKRWLVRNYAGLFPKQIGWYFEPFLGSGAAFFHMRPKKAVLSDINAELVNVFSAIRDEPGKVYRALKRHSQQHDVRHYYTVRTRSYHARHLRAAQFLYLNRTCWNGLYRVNLRGEFNVPKGSKEAVLLDTDNFQALSEVLARAKITTSDFEPILARANAGDFAFIDPPYVTRHNFNGFTKYNDRIFSWADQERLANSVRDAARRGVRILLTNADHASVWELYRDFAKRISLSRHSVLAADTANRGAITEMALLVNYEFEPAPHRTRVHGVSSDGSTSNASAS